MIDPAMAMLIDRCLYKDNVRFPFLVTTPSRNQSMEEVPTFSHSNEPGSTI